MCYSTQIFLLIFWELILLWWYSAFHINVNYAELFEKIDFSRCLALLWSSIFADKKLVHFENKSSIAARKIAREKFVCLCKKSYIA